MNMRRNAGGEIWGAAAGVNQVPPQALAAAMEMHVNPIRLTDGEVTALVEMAQAITLQDQAMTAQAKQRGVPKENPPSNTIVSRLRDFTRIHPPFYTWSKISNDIKEDCRESMLHDSMDLSRLMVDVQQVEANRKRKRTRAGNRSRQAKKNFSRKSNTEIRDKPGFKK